MKNLIFLFLFLSSFTEVDAISTLVDGVYYEIYFYNEEASVIKSQGSGYSGEIIIRSSVTYEGKSYPVTAIGEKACRNCVNLTAITIPQSVKTIGSQAFEGCKGLKSVTIPSSVTNIGNNAFLNCDALTSVTIPSSVIFWGNSAFGGCDVLASVTIMDGVTSIGANAFSNCDALTSVSIPNSVTDIGVGAFSGCDALTSIIIPSSIINLGNDSFTSCNSLKTAYVSAAKIGDYAFQNCSNLSTLELGDNVKEIGNYSFCGIGITSVTIPEGVTSIGSDAFGSCKALTSVTIPSSVTSIGSCVFSDCSNLDSIYLPDNIEKIASQSFQRRSGLIEHGEYYNDWNAFKIFVNNGTKTILRLWYAGYLPYDKETGQLLAPYENVRRVTASSFSINVKYNYPELFDYKFSFDGNTLEGTTVSVNKKGLDPGRGYAYYIYVKLKDGSEDYYGSGGYSKRYEINTLGMKLVTQQPKVISTGNVIVSAETNVDEAEENVGFEWRRTDWSDDFASNTGGAYIFEGTMEGYIRNLNAEKLWKYRCYYLSRSGKYYYGDWVGLDPSNTSYFEPTVHTYKDVETTGNTALVRGYALRGTDGIKVQGFVYWRDVAGSRRLAPSIPSNAKTIEATGQVMTAMIDNLESGVKYCYAAFVTTTEGETFYGEQREFTTTDISGIEEQAVSSYRNTKESYYDIDGHRLNKTKKGLNIVRMNNGTVRKVIVR